MIETYNSQETVVLTYSRAINGALVSGLTVNILIKNAVTGATLLASTSMPEIGSSGIYTYSWTHGLTAEQTECLVQYTAGTRTVFEHILITNMSGGRTS